MAAESKSKRRKEKREPPVAEAGYPDSKAHLQAHLARIDRLVRAQTMRWRTAIAEKKPSQLWGIAQISDAEIDAYLAAPVAGHLDIDPQIEAVCAPYWAAALADEQAIRQRAAATPADRWLRLEHLVNTLELGGFERDVLLLCLLPETDPAYRRLFGYLMDDAAKPAPTVELILTILAPYVARHPAAARAAFAHDAPLRHWRLVSVESGAAASPPSLATVSLDPQVCAYLLGGETIDALLRPFTRVRHGEAGFASLFIEEDLRARLEAFANGSGYAGPVYLSGRNGDGRWRAASAAAAAHGGQLFCFDLRSAAAEPSMLEGTVRCLLREARLWGASVYIEHAELLFEQRTGPAAETAERALAIPPAMAKRVLAWFAQSGLTVWLAVPEGTNPSRDPTLPDPVLFRFARPDAPLRRRIWEALLGDPGVRESIGPCETALDLLSGSFQMNQGQIRAALSIARGKAMQRDPEKPSLSMADLLQGCRDLASGSLAGLAQPAEAPQGITFDDVVLPAATMQQIGDFRRRIRLRHRLSADMGGRGRLMTGNGLVVLFSGGSGTGKTLTAALLAREAGVELYKIDVSALVSKYIGETEKNLERLFTEAETANAILFFDEADALFGKRGEIKGAHDRWANMEVNFLLQRIEQFDGIVILATNMDQNIDGAFRRRMHLQIEFPFPDATARAKIWRAHLPENMVPPEETVIADLAERFPLAGGHIRNVVCDAAFRALEDSDAERPAIEQRHLAVALGREYLKLGRPITAGEFGQAWYRLIQGERTATAISAR